MIKNKIRLVIGIVIVLLTVSVFVIYLDSHRNLLTQLGHTSILTIISVFALYIVMLGVLMVILDATLRLCNKKLDSSENFVLNSYSILINFLVPGQGGPAFRGLYLKRLHKIKIRNYIVATLLYYAIYGMLSVFLLLVTNKPWWQTTLLVLLMTSALGSAVLLYSRRTKATRTEFNFRFTTISYLLVATIIQSLVQVVIYYVELHSSSGHISLAQTITYTGAANLALFVSLTPGAIGIRESFLVFTERLHHISSGSIVVANVIDRSIYLIFILVLIPLLIGLRFKSKNKSIYQLLPSSLTKLPNKLLSFNKPEKT